MLYKYCAKCKKLKSVDNFSLNKITDDGFMTNCKQCECKRAKENYRRLKDDNESKR